MQNSLRNQLNKLKENQKSAPILPYKAQSSLLFDFKYVNKIDVETIFELGYEGLIELSKIEEKFTQYFKTLFEPTSKYFNRETTDEAETKKKDSELKKLLVSLSNYFYNPNCHQVIEYLIKVYKVNIFLTEYFIFPFLCYYNNTIFIKMIQNINYKENEQFSFMEENAKNGIIIYKNDIIKYFSDNTHFNFFVKIIDFYIKNISLTVFEYYEFILDILEYKINNMENIKKDKDKNFFNILIKIINYINKNFNNLDEQNYSKYLNKYQELFDIILKKINLTNDIIKALTTDMIINIFKKCNLNQIYSLLSLNKILSKKFYDNNISNNESLYKNDTIEILSKELDEKDEIKEYFINNKINTEYFIYELILSNNNNISNNIRPILILYFEDIENIENLLLLLTNKKNKNIKDLTYIFSNILEDINQNNLNKVFIKLYKQRKITDLPIKNDNINIYISLLSPSIPQVINALNQLNSNEDKLKDENIINALATKFNFNDEEIILNSILNLKGFDAKILSKDIFEFYINMMKKYNMNKYSEAFKINVEKILNKIYQNNSNIIFSFYSTIIFNNNNFKINSLDDQLILNKKTFIDELNRIIKTSKETNKGINIKNILNYFEMYFKTNIINEEELFSIENLLSEPILYKYYDKLFSTILRGYIPYLSKYNNKFNHIVKLYQILNNNQDSFSTFFGQLLSINFSYINQQQMFLAYLLLLNNQSSNNKLLLEFVFDVLKNSKCEDFILSISLLFHLNEISLDSFTFYFNIKREIIFNKLSCIINNNSKLMNINMDKYIINSVKKLMENINNDKNELKINKNYLRRLFESKLINLEHLYFVINILLMDNENNLNENLPNEFINIIIKILSLFTKKVSFSQNNKKMFMNIIEKSFYIKNNLICNILIKNFILYYTESTKELIFFLAELKNKNKSNNFKISEDIINILFENGFDLSLLNAPEELFTIIQFCLNNDISPYALNIKPIENKLVIKYLDYIQNQFVELAKLDEIQVIYFYKILLINQIKVNKEILLKTFKILEATENININICYSIYSLIKNIEIISTEEKEALNRELPKIFKKLLSVLNLENNFNYEEEKKIQLIISSSNLLCVKCNNEKNKKNQIILDSYNIVMNSNLSQVIKNEIFNIIFECILEFINQIEVINEEFFYEYIQTIIKHPLILYNDKIIIDLQKSKIIKNKEKASSFLFYICYETFVEKKNEVFNEIIFNNDNYNDYSLFDWMKIIELLLLLKNTQEKIVYELISNIFITLLKENKNNKSMNIEENENKTSEIILNIITILFNKNKEISNKIIQLCKKENLLSNIFISMYSIKDKYNKSKNYLLSKIIEYISPKDEYLYEYIMNNIIIENIEKKYENLIYVYQLMIKLAKKKNTNILDLLKKCLDKIIAIELNTSPTNKDAIYYKYYFTICNYLIHISNLYGITLIKYFNNYLHLFINGIKDIILANRKKLKNKDNKEKEEEISLIKENANIIYHDLDILTNGNLCNYLSPFLKDLIEAIICLNLDEMKEILSRLAAKNEFDQNFNAIILNKSKLNPLLIYFFQVTIESGDKLTIADCYKEIIKFFLQIMEKYQKYKKEIIICMKSFILKINEKQLKEIFEQLLSYINEKDDNKDYILSNSIIVIQIFNTLLEVIHDIFVEGYFTKYKNILIQLIHLSNSFIFKEEKESKLGEKRARTINEGNEDFNYFKLSCLLLENIKLNFKYSKGKLLVETQEELFDPVIEQYKLSEDEEKMMNYYDISIQDCILEMFKNIQSDDLFKELNDELLNLIREDSYVTKLLVLKTITIALETLKERYLAQVADIIPYVSELLEDSNTEVKKYAVELIKFIEKLTGESYQSYLE